MVRAVFTVVILDLGKLMQKILWRELLQNEKKMANHDLNIVDENITSFIQMVSWWMLMGASYHNWGETIFIGI